MPFFVEQLSPEENLFLFLLREDDKNCDNLLSNNEINYTSFFAMLEDHYLTGIICLNLLEKYGKHLDASIKAYCKMRVLQIVEENKVKKKLLSQASQILQKKGIPVLVLKGPALDSSRTQIRYYNDLDILIPQNDLLKAVGVLEYNGYEYRGSDILSDKEKRDIPGQLSWNNQYQFRFPGMSQEIEVHTNLFERKRVRFENLGALLDNIEVFSERQSWDEDLNVHIPCPESSLALLCLQTALKRSPANNTYILRQAYDMKQLLSQGIAWKYFLSLCQKWKISYYVFFAFELQKKVFDDLSSPIMNDLEDLLTNSEKRLALIHLNCFINFKNNSLFHMFLYRLVMPFAIGGGLKKTINWYFRSCFPRKTVQAKRYNISQNSIWVWVSYLINPFRAFMIRTQKR